MKVKRRDRAKEPSCALDAAISLVLLAYFIDELTGMVGCCAYFRPRVLP